MYIIIPSLAHASPTGHSGPIGSISLEEGIADDVFRELRRFGHDISGPVGGFDRTLFGRGHVIQVGYPKSEEAGRNDVDMSRVYQIGCEPRSDGKPQGY